MLPHPDFPRPPVLAEPVRILLVEDDRISAEIVTAYLRRIAPAASALHSAADLAEALAVLARAEVDLVIADLHLPDSAGVGTIEALVRVVGCPVIAITSDADPGLRNATLACGAYDFLHKGDLAESTLARLVRLAAVQARTFRSLRESEGRLRAIMNHEPQCVKLLDGEGRLIEMNPAGLRMIEADSLEPLRGQCVYGLVVAEHRAAFRDLTERVVRGEEGTLEFEIVGLKGGRRWLETRAVPLRDDVSGKQLVLGITRDVTERRRGEAALRESEARFRALTELSSDVYWEQDAELCFTKISGNSPAWLESGRGHMLGQRRWERPYFNMTEADWAAHRADLAARRAFRDLELGRLNAEGERVWLSVSGEPVFGPAGEFQGYRGVGKDITARKREERLLRLEHETTRKLAAAATAAEGVRAVMEALCTAEDWKCGRFFRHDPAAGVVRFDEAASYHAAGFEALNERSRGLTFERGAGLTGEVWASGRALWVSDTSRDPRVQQVLAQEPRLRSAFCFPVLVEGAVAGVVTMWNDRIREPDRRLQDSIELIGSLLGQFLRRKEGEARVAYLAQFDALTGLPNRTLLADRFSQMIMHATRHAAPVAVLFIDLDGFKTVNDTLGHAGGDALLKEVAVRLQSTVRGGDTVARISGDEFAIVLGDLARLDDAALVAQKVIDRLAAAVSIGGKEVFVTASVGIAVFPGDGADAEALIGAADAAMYRAKQSGRNAYQFFTAEINQRSRARAQMGADLWRALEREELMLAYQPKVDLATRRIIGAEALLRWKHPERGMVPPAEFIPVMEETGLIVPVGDWVLRRACEDLKAWQAAGIAVGAMAVNLSARQFRRTDLDTHIQALVAAVGVDPGLIELEITESQLMIDPDHAIRVMRALCDAGMRIAIDDFGTGYSSLAYLNRFPVSALKIDRSFVKDMSRKAGDATIVRTIIEMARSLGCTVVAEGVETEEQAAFLRRLRCEQAQGYLFARPVPAADFVRLLEKRPAPRSPRRRRR